MHDIRGRNMFGTLVAELWGLSTSQPWTTTIGCLNEAWIPSVTNWNAVPPFMMTDARGARQDRHPHAAPVAVFFSTFKS